MKYTILVTQNCNLRCTYCYIGKRRQKASLPTARRIVDFAYAHTPDFERIEFGFFGGEPLLEFPLIRQITRTIEDHPKFDPNRVHLSIVSNGTIFTPQVAGFVAKHNVNFAISCDGPPAIHDTHRRFRNGRGSGRIVERTVRQATSTLPAVPVNAVFCPQTLEHLSDTVSYLSSLGVRQIHLNADISANWGQADAELAPKILKEIGQKYVDFYLCGDPHFINLIDSKIAVILRGGYRPLERCRMGAGEFAFAPDGSIYPCERLVGDGDEKHRIGHIRTGFDPPTRHCGATVNHSLREDCMACGLREYCMNGCGCTNYFATGSYERAGPFHCAFERATLSVAFEALQTLEKELGATFFEHLSGFPCANSHPIQRDSEAKKSSLAEDQVRRSQANSTQT